MKAKTKNKRKPKDIFAGKRDPVSQLYRAVKRYVEYNHGNIMVIGGIQLEEWDSMKGRFVIGVKCLGRRPVFKSGLERTSFSKSPDGK